MFARIWLVCVFVRLRSVLSSAAARRDFAEEFAAVAKYVNDNGGYVSGRLKGNVTYHGGMEVRGVIADRPIIGNDLLIRVPKHLWIALDNFPDFAAAELPSVCNSTPVELDCIKTVGALAAETHRGPRSPRYEYLRMLPPLEDFETFHPRFVRGPLLIEFAALPIIQQAIRLQKIDAKLKTCFEEWKSVPHSLVSALSWHEMASAFAQFRTRRFDVGVGVMIPVMDMFNTEKPANVNTHWGVSKDEFVQQSRANMLGKLELLDHYCPVCNNDNLLMIWGVYIEDNPNPLVADVDCESVVPAGGQPSETGDTAKSLREAAESMLDVSFEGRALALSRGWNSPRCRADAIASTSEGPLKCSLARLAWEYCARSWQHGLNLPAEEFKQWGHSVLQPRRKRRSLARVGVALRSPASLNAAALIEKSSIHGEHNLHGTHRESSSVGADADVLETTQASFLHRGRSTTSAV